MILAPDGNKMSKSKGNTIEPGGIIDQGYGADSIRIMELFIGPWNQSANWSVEGMGGSFRFLQRIWQLVDQYRSIQSASNDSGEAVLRATHKAIKKVTQDLERLSFNTAIAAQMEFVNELYKLKMDDSFANSEAWKFAIESLLKILAPFAPHIAEELWKHIGQESSIHISQWPSFEEKYLVEDSTTIVVQVNGKVRGEVEVAADSEKDAIIAAASSLEKVAGYLNNQDIKKTIYVPGRLVNFVV